MTPYLLAFGILASASALGAWLHHRRPAAATAFAGLALALLLLKVSVGYWPAAEPRIFPWDWYPWVEAWWWTVPGMFLLGAGVAAVRTSVWKRDAVLVVLGLLAVRGSALAWEGNSDHPKLRGEVDETGLCLQTSMYSCAAASAAMFLHRFGVPANEREMAVLCATRPFGGTSDSGLLRGLRRKLPGVRVAISSPRYEEIPTPSLVSLRYGALVAHCVLVREVHRDRVLLTDPQVGRRNVPRVLFDRMWRGTAVFVAPE